MRQLLFALLSLCAAGAFSGAARAEGIVPEYQGPPLPPFALQDLHGNTVDLAALRGQVVLVNFWATWCPPCVEEMPSLERLQDRLEGRPFKLLAVNMGETPKQIGDFLEHLPLDITILLDPDGIALRKWKVFAVPSSYIIAPDGRVSHAYTGTLEWDDDEVVELVERLIAEG